MAFSSSFVNHITTNRTLSKVGPSQASEPEVSQVKPEENPSLTQEQKPKNTVEIIRTVGPAANILGRIDYIENQLKTMDSKIYEIKNTFDEHSKNVSDILRAFELKFNDYIDELDKLKQSFFTETNTLLIHNTTEINNINSILKQQKLVQN